MPRIALIVLLLLSLAMPIHAEDDDDASSSEGPQTSEDASKELNSTLTAIKESDAREKQLEQKTAQLEAELKSLQEEMVEMGKDTSLQEQDLSSYEDKLSILEEQKKEKTRALNARQAELSTMISAMVKLQQLPPEAIIAMPGKLDETLATARALGVVTHAIEEEAQSLKEQLRELDVLEDKIHHNRYAIATRKTSLGARQLELSAKMKERNALIEKLGGEEHKEREKAASLMAKSQNLQDLVDSLKKSEEGLKQHKKEAASGESDAKKAHHALRSFANAKGRIHVPAAGKVVSHYGNTDVSVTFSKGIVIETREDADVVAPFDGEVVFAGPFRDYGNIVIIRHSGEYHTMISGMEQVDCKPGQYLLEGEPIGSMGGAGTTKLYLELREDGRPVDPSPWLKG